MRGLSLGQGIVAAIKADTLSLTAFEVGLFGWMALMRFVLFQPPIHPGRAQALQQRPAHRARLLSVKRNR